MVFRKSPTWSTVSYVNDTPANIRNFVSYTASPRGPEEGVDF